MNRSHRAVAGGESTRHRALGQITRFASVGALNTLVDFTTFNLLVYAAGFRPLSANALSVGAGILNSYVWNKFWTFKDTSRTRVITQATMFFAVSIMGLFLNSLALKALLTISYTVDPLTLNTYKAISLIASSTWNFLAYKKLVFSDWRDRDR